MNRPVRPGVRRCLLLLVACAAPALSFVACGGKSSEEEDAGSGSSAGSSAQGGGSGSDAGAGARGGTSSAGSTGSGGNPFMGLDAGAECVECVSTTCPEAEACLTNPACVQGALCAATTCTATDAGEADALACWLGCFNNDTAAALSAFTAFSCVLSNCSEGCMTAFGP